MTTEAVTPDIKRRALALVIRRGHEQREEPFLLASGRLSHDYIDGKFAIDNGPHLRLISEAIVALADDEGIEFSAVGGLTMGADPLAHGIAMVANCVWFSVRKLPKAHGRDMWIEGGRLTEQDRVLLVDDVVTTGGSILKACECVRLTGATVAGAIPMLDRGVVAAPLFDVEGIKYRPLLTYDDLGIEPVEDAP